MFILPKNDICHYEFTINKVRNILISCQDLLIRLCDTGDTSCVILGVILGMILKVSKRDPSKRGQLYT